MTLLNLPVFSHPKSQMMVFIAAAVLETDTRLDWFHRQDGA